MPEKKPLLTISEVSELLHVAKGTIFNWVSARKIPFVKIGGCLRFDPDQIDQMIEAKSTQAKEID